MKTILIADDDPHINQMLQQFLSSEGYHVLVAHNGQEAIDMSENNTISLAILDVMMPEKNGFQVCRKIRENQTIPVILLTAKGEMVDKEQGFQAGTDDYITKPFELKELLFRMNALFRRYQIPNQAIIDIGNLKIDTKNYLVTLEEKELYLPLKEFQVLLKLASYPKKIFTRDELIESIWGLDYEGNDRTVDVHIKRLRQHLTKESSIAITTVRGIGYRLEELE
ncbi:response regulator transcription factor [Carnobacterium gallinarum]|uniref:response regulator transcription factor n=1 Tax=Carnobacterium gallinarum TaxID=2749 RepID=UPI00055922AB|nr:response regulator transcription factor [Carnobacterium gallinarum]